ncbi:MAG: hypothetical protein IJE89_02850 [Bacilli bacterium]|nr:hypothetical protein [Bacilli bacterium]
MKNIKYSFLTLMLFLICITNTYAACTEEAKKEFKKIEDQYTVKYKYDKTTKSYEVTFGYTKSNMYGYETDESLSDMEYIKSDEKGFTARIKKPGEYKINVVGVTQECNDTLKTITLKLPEYNKYADDPLCEGIEEFVLCQPTYDKEIDYETFVSRVNTYKKTKKPNEKQEEEQIEEKLNMFQYIKDNLGQIIIISSFAILLTITIVITAKSIKESRRLE